MALHLTQHRAGFGPGWTEITTLDEREDPTGIALSVFKLGADEGYGETMVMESAWLLMAGEVGVKIDGRWWTLRRDSLFDDPPSCLHLAAGTRMRMSCATEVEFCVFRTANQKTFTSRVFEPGDVREEARGKGLVDNASLRNVRTIFDGSNSEPDVDLVLGEVVHLPGRWSSYPGHHHPQPELYHYRFTEPQGYGHAELGDTVLKVRQYDTVKILPPHDHAQVAAPGYGMIYSWVIRHLPGDRYDLPEFTAEHAWAMQDDAEVWLPADPLFRDGPRS